MARRAGGEPRVLDNAALFITDAEDPDTASTEVEVIISCALEGLKPPK